MGSGSDEAAHRRTRNQPLCVLSKLNVRDLKCGVTVKSPLNVLN
jgi:hypothetical protein